MTEKKDWEGGGIMRKTPSREMAEARAWRRGLEERPRSGAVTIQAAWFTPLGLVSLRRAMVTSRQGWEEEEKRRATVLAAIADAKVLTSGIPNPPSFRGRAQMLSRGCSPNPGKAVSSGWSLWRRKPRRAA
jgi:hypothetical protein